jgi:hypothetical protein
LNPNLETRLILWANLETLTCSKLFGLNRLLTPMPLLHSSSSLGQLEEYEDDDVVGARRLFLCFFAFLLVPPPLWLRPFRRWECFFPLDLDLPRLAFLPGAVAALEVLLQPESDPFGLPSPVEA